MIKDVLEKYKERIPVRVLAELLADIDEAEAECCEWKKLLHYRYIYSPHEKNQGIWVEELENKPFCPYCGKKIKVVE